MSNRQINFYQFKGGGKPPFYAVPLMILLVLLVIGVLAVFGLFIGIVVAIGVIILGILRFVTSFGSKKPDKVTENPDGSHTITLDENDYEVIEKDTKPEP